MAKTVALRIDLQLDGGGKIDIAAKNMAELRSEIARVAKEVSMADLGSANFTKLNGALTALRDTYKNLGKEGADATKELAALSTRISEQPKAIGYYRQLQQELTKLTNQYKDLSKVDLGGSVGSSLQTQIAGINTQLKGFDAGLGNYQRSVGNYKTAFGGIGAAFSKLSGLLGASLAAISGGSEIINATRAYESLFAVLKQGIGSDFAAQGIFKDLQEFATKTPESLNSVVSSFNKLSATGIRPTVDELTKLTDLSKFSGKSLDQLSEALIDAQGFEFTRLQEFGVRIKANGDQLLATFRGQQTELPKTEKAVRDYVLSLGDLSGVQGSSAAVAKTLEGAISNLFDGFQQLFNSIGGYKGVLADVISGFGDLIGAVNDYLEKPLSENLQSQRFEFNVLIGTLTDVTTSYDTKQESIRRLNENYLEYIGNIDLEKSTYDQLNKVLASGNKLFDSRILFQQRDEQVLQNQKEQLENTKKIAQAQIRIRELSAGADRGLGEGLSNLLLGNGGDLKLLNSDIGQLANSNIKLQAEAKKSKEVLNETSKLLFGIGLDDFASEQIKANEAAAKKQSAAAAATATAARAATKKQSGKGGKQKIDTLILAEGSIANTEEQLRKLNEELRKAPSGTYDNLIAQIVELEKKLDSAKAKIDLAKIFTANPNLKLTVEVLPTISAIDEKALSEQISALGNKAKQENADARVKELISNLPIAGELTNALGEEKKKDENRQLLINSAIDTASQINSAIANIENDRVSTQLDASIAAIEAEYDAKRLAANGNAQILLALDADRQAKLIDAEKAAAKKRKQIALREAIVAGALAVVKALPNPFAAAAAAIAAAIQIATINAQQFAFGGKVKRVTGFVNQAPNAPKTKNGDNILAYLKAGELVMNERQQARAANLFGNDFAQRIGIPNVGKIASNRPMAFAGGGFVGGGSIYAKFTEEDIEQIAAILAPQIGYAVEVGVQKGQRIAAEANRRRDEVAARTA